MKKSFNRVQLQHIFEKYAEPASMLSAQPPAAKPPSIGAMNSGSIGAPAKRYSADELAGLNTKGERDIFGEMKAWQPAVSRRLPTGSYTRQQGGAYVDDATGAQFDRYGNPAGGTYSADGNSWSASPDVLKNFGISNTSSLAQPTPPPVSPQPAPPIQQQPGGTLTMNPATSFSPSVTLSGGSNGVTAAQPTQQNVQSMTQAIPPAQQPATQPAPAQQQPAQQQPAAQSMAQAAKPMQAPDYDGAMKSYQAAKTPQEQQKVLQDLTKSMEGSITDTDRAGANDVLSGKMDTPAAKAFIDQKLGPAGDEYAKQFVQQEIANKPEVAQNPTMFGQLQSTAQDMWQGMGTAGQLAFAFGVPMAMIGLMGGGGLTSLLGGLGIGALGLGAAGMGMFGNDTRASTGKMMNDVYGFFSGNNVPQSLDEVVGSAGEQKAMQDIEAAMNAPGADGRLGGFAAGNKALQQSLQRADTLLNMPRDAAITSVMGMGAKTPEEAEGVLQQIAAKRQEASAPDYIYNQARQKALTKLQAKDEEHDGALDAFFKARRGEGGTANWLFGVDKARENRIRQVMESNPEYQQFLQRDEAGNVILPEGNTMDEFADSMLRNAYGDYQQKAGSHNIGRFIFARACAKQNAVRTCIKSARCWAGYEPVPGKKPYSNDSCRPVGSKKKKTDKKKSTK